VADADFSIKAHDTLPTLRVAFTIPDPADPTGATRIPLDFTLAVSVKLIMKLEGAGTTKVNAAGSFYSRAGGVLEYDWTSTDTNAPGHYQGEFEVIWPGAQKQTVPTESYFTIDVLADLDNA
jgi:hypothetical protein